LETVLPDGTTGGANSELSDEAETDVASDIIEDEVSVDETSSLVLSFSFVCVDSSTLAVVDSPFLSVFLDLEQPFMETDIITIIMISKAAAAQARIIRFLLT
jgi:hypothetical protein